VGLSNWGAACHLQHVTCTCILHNWAHARMSAHVRSSPASQEGPWLPHTNTKLFHKRSTLHCVCFTQRVAQTLPTLAHSGQLHAAAPFLRSSYQKMPDFPPCVCNPTYTHAQSA